MIYWKQIPGPCGPFLSHPASHGVGLMPDGQWPQQETGVMARVPKIESDAYCGCGCLPPSVPAPTDMVRCIHIGGEGAMVPQQAIDAVAMNMPRIMMPP